MLSSSSSGVNCWQMDLCRAVCESWPYFIGGIADVHMGNSPVAIWSTGQQGNEDSEVYDDLLQIKADLIRVNRFTVSRVWHNRSQPSFRLPHTEMQMNWRPLVQALAPCQHIIGCP